MHHPVPPILPASQGLAEASPQSTAGGPPLPIEIGFLADHGVSPAFLREAALRARTAGVTADMYLVRGGDVDETAFYRALAAELAVPFSANPRLGRAARYPDAALSGIADLPSGLVLAPQGEGLARLLRSPRAPRGTYSLTTPSRLARSLLRDRGGAVARMAALALPERRPDLSGRDGASHAQIALLAILALTLSFGSVAAPHGTLAAAGLALSPLFLGMVVLRLAAALLPPPAAPSHASARSSEAALPVYSVIVALYRETEVAARLVTALRALDYPAAKLDIKFVLEADDPDTLAVLARLPLPGCIEVLVAPSGEPRTKPRALNVALPLVRGPFVVVYDADDVPDPGQLRASLAAFARLSREVACLQARLAIDNTDDTWLTRLFTIEYAALFDVFNPGLAEIGSPVALGGTSNHFRTAALRRAMGWDAWNVTEDADLGLRLARFGYRVADLASSTLEEAPGTLRAWMNQRTRWMKGFMQTAIVHSRHPRRVLGQLGPWRSMGALVLTYGTVLSALSYPLFGLAMALHLSREVPASPPWWESAWLAGSQALFLSGIAALFVPAGVALGRRKLWRLLPWLPLLPLYYGLVSIAAWRALGELAAAPFRWNKTRHGLARTSRTGLLQKHQARPASTMSLNTDAP